MYKFELYSQLGLADFDQPLDLKMNHLDDVVMNEILLRTIVIGDLSDL